jgi:HPt (histidine-containing phosphotransfer) domain-containing protein
LVSDPSNKDRINCECGAGGGPSDSVAGYPILDISHLERQVQDDGELRDELLRLYAGRLEMLGPKLHQADGQELREAAHALKGASLAIGAFALAEFCGRLDIGEETDGQELARVIEATRLRVGELIGEARGAGYRALDGFPTSD